MDIVGLVVMCAYSIVLLWQVREHDKLIGKLTDDLNEARNERDKYRALLELKDDV